MSTKEKILQTALRLFNEHGTDAITVRHIAKEMQISHGNLCYHYPTTDIIIEKLYEQLVEKLTAAILSVPLGKIDLQLVYDASLVTYRLFHEYRFLMLDFVRITRRIPGIREHYRQLVGFRHQQFSLVFEALIANGLLKPPAHTTQLEDYITQLFVFGNFWLSEAEIVFDKTEEEKIRYFHRVAFGSLVPLLTEKGWKEFQKTSAKLSEASNQ